MLIAFWLLLFMYVGVTFLYAITNTDKPKISPWPIISVAPVEESVDVACKRHRDCPSTHVCLGGKCIPKLLRVNECDPKNGQWISYDYRGITFAICVCLKPHLMNQKFFGGNCDVNVGCGVHGRYLPWKNACECDPGYKAVGLTCKKLPAIDYANMKECGQDEIRVADIKPSDGFHPDYVKRLSPLKCVKRPCTFDALSGKPLKRTKFQDNWGCVCDPRYGNFGVVLESQDKKYLKTPGFDACANIFEEELRYPIDVKLIKYFYLGKRDPLSFILFENLDKDNLISLFREKDHIFLSQKLWQYDYAQHFFDSNETLRARTRHVSSFWLFTHIEKVNEWLYVNDFTPANCHEIPSFWEDRLNPRVDAYNLLYKSPVCRVVSDDPKADPMFWNKVVVNPQHLTFKEHDHLHRYNSFVLYYDSEVGAQRWTVDLDYDYNANDYMSIETNVPHYEVEQNKKPDFDVLMLEGQM